jgi:hypothetical protein
MTEIHHSREELQEMFEAATEEDLAEANDKRQRWRDSGDGIGLLLAH